MRRKPRQVRTGGELNFAPYQGRVSNPNIHYGEADIETAGQIMILNGHDFLRVQLSNGWDRTSYGLRQNFLAGYLFGQTPFSPGLTRMQQQNPADVMPRGASPSQWFKHWMRGPGAQPDYPGGPGMTVGRIISPGSGA
jgi:hypothetical protein